METPVSTNRRRSRLPDRRKIHENKSSPNLTSTPSIIVNQRDSIVSLVEGYNQDPSDDDDDDYMLSSTQGFLPARDGEVYWNYEASPATKEALRRKQDESDSPDSGKPIPPPKSIFSSIRLKGRQPKVPELDSEAIQLLDELKGMCEEVQRQQEEAADDKVEDDASEEDETIKTLSKEQNNTFSSDDDSFLVLATQQVDEKVPSPKAKTTSITNNTSLDANQNNRFSFKTPSTAVSSVSASTSKPSCSTTSAFDDDDDFDSLLSQIEMPTTTPPTTNRVPIKQAPKSIVEDPPPVHVLASVKSSSTFKRFKSAGSVTTAVTPGSHFSASANIMKSWRRTKSSPDAPLGPPLPGGRNVKPKCSQEAIEMKRQEALKRRHQRSQQLLRRPQ
jgi:hypothetical protein